MSRTGRVLTSVVLLVALGVGVMVLRSQTLSTHTVRHPDTRLAVVVDVSSRHSESSRLLEEVATAQVFTCRLEVAGEPVGPLEPLDDDPTRFRFVLRPALDRTDRRQFEGCIEDWRIDHVRLRIVSMREHRVAG